MPTNHNPHRIICHADDEKDDRLLFLDAVDELGLSVTIHKAAGGQQLLDMLFHKSVQLPEIIFLDINMPGKGGFECLEEIKREKGLQDVKIVML